MSHRTQITLTDDQYDQLRSESRRTGLGLAELVRQALSHAYGPTRGTALVDALEESFGAWHESTPEGPAYVESVRPGMASRLTR